MIDISQYLIFGFPAAAIIIAVVRVLRETGLPSKYAPITSIVLGIACGMIMAIENGNSILSGVVVGIVVGASSCGLYDLGKINTNSAHKL